jgi:hypothetical protein
MSVYRTPRRHVHHTVLVHGRASIVRAAHHRNKEGQNCEQEPSALTRAAQGSAYFGLKETLTAPGSSIMPVMIGPFTVYMPVSTRASAS